MTAQRKRRGWAPTPRKPETMSVSGHLGHAEVLLALAARHIDTAGDLVGTERADMLACYASNVLQGAHALIRELRAALKKGRPGGMHGSDANPRQKTCSQCGQLFTRGACGPTHAAVQAYRASQKGTP